MFKLPIKLTVISLIFLGAGLCLTSGRAAADQCSDADPVNGRANWGVSLGENANALAGTTVHATVGTYANADNSTASSDKPGNYNSDQDVAYTLNSANSAEGDNRIFIYPAGAEGRTNQYPGYTGAALHDGSNTISCDGWDVLGPGQDIQDPLYPSPGHQQKYVPQWGTGWVIDCGTQTPGGYVFTRLWISNISKPSGQDGYWEVQTRGANAPQDVNVNQMGPGNSQSYFTVTNGATAHVNLIWHQKKPAAQSTGVCNYLKVDNASPSNGRTTRTEVYSSGIPGIGSPANVPGKDGGNNGSSWNFYPNANSIDVVIFQQWQDSSNNWNNAKDSNGNILKFYLRSDGSFAPVTYTHTGSTWSEDPHPTIPCFSAQCSITSVDGDGPGGIVLAGGRMTVHGTYVNTSPPPSNLNIISPALTIAGSQYAPNNGTHTLWASPPPAYEGWSYDFSINLTAPSSVTTEDFSLTPVYYGTPPAAIGAPCYAKPFFAGQPGGVYQQFSASVSAQSDVSPTIENPSGDNYGATITHQWVNPPAGMSGHGINNPVTASFYQKKAGGGQTTPCSPSSYSSSGPYNVPSPAPPGYDTIWSHNCAIAPGSFAAGDEFCSTVSAQYSGGYVGPDNNVVDGTGPTSDTNCPRVVNEPYFKVYHSDISAGGDFDKCTTNGGTLAGYADISDPAGATRGSTTQLSALALLKITGVASAKTSADINGSPTKLTFANTGVQVDSGGNESPVLGGQFGGCRTLTNETAPASAKNLAGSSTGAVPAAGPGAYTHSGNLTISGGTLGVNQNVSMFVTGNVYISSDITYGNGWQAGTAPSFILHATGNIYIDPGVKQLAGVYIAQQKLKSDNTPDTTTGKIYTCADPTGFAPMSAANLYNGCKNQLVVYGSFVADQINLMRSFGSLRDEIPNPGSPGVAAVPLCWTSAHNCQGWNCTQINEPAEPASHTWNDNYLCVQPGSSLQLAWTHWPDDHPYDPKDPDPGDAPLSYLKNPNNNPNYPYCTEFTVKGDPSWDDNEPNWLCMNQKRSDNSPLIQFSSTDLTSSTTHCLNIHEALDPDAQWNGTGYFLCQPIAPGSAPTSAGPPFTGCSNKGTETDTNACAGEIFEYSPALYLSNGGGTTQPSGGGSLQLQSITSLPPVL